MPNRLAAERSPYLLQHAQNPVNWYPWGREAFEEAVRLDRPIFLSIGYSTCHWCHVMAHESFDEPAIAELLNSSFISIKVDREERPDIDRVYMAFVQATTGSGGWPMSVWLTPDLKPFYGGTYFPPQTRWGRPGFAEILREIARVWKEERAQVQTSAETLTERLRALRLPPQQGLVAEPEALIEGVAQFAQTFDQHRGGFGDAPKFPRPSELLFLLREGARTGEAVPTQMVARTLQAMALGGMRDHIGGGFHRYSVDAEWRVPHFEKMLYDQAQLVLAYLEAYQATGDQFYAEVAEDTLQYVRREMTSSDGAFFSAEDADSVPPEQAADPDAHKSEGAFYLWREEEIRALLGEAAEFFKLRFGVLPGGNAPQDPQGEFTGRNLLYVARSIETVAGLTGRPVEVVERALAHARVTLFKARLGRPRPHLDDKVLAAWNGLMLAAFARAARVLEATAGRHLETARAAAAFLERVMWDRERRVLLRTFRAGQAGIDGYAEDYAFVIFGLIELFQAGGDPEWLEWALALQHRQDELFADAEGGGWFSTTGRDPHVLLRLKDDHDGAEPSASSVSVLNLLALSHLTGEAGMFDQVERTFKMFGPRIGQLARAVPMMMAGLSAHHAGIRQVVIVGPRQRADTLALLRQSMATYDPFSVLVPVEPGENQDRLARALPFVATTQMREGRATAYICRDFVCVRPVTDVEGFRQQLTSAADRTATDM